MWASRAFFSDCRQVSNVSAFILESFPNLFATWLECTRFPSPLSLPMLSYLFILFPLHGAFLCRRFPSCIFFCSESLSGGINTNSGTGSVEHPLCKGQNAFFFFLYLSPSPHPQLVYAILAGHIVLAVWLTQYRALKPEVFIREDRGLVVICRK